MTVTEFQIRAWQSDETHLQILVHSSPAGDIRKPITVACDMRQLDATRRFFQDSKWFLNPDLHRLLVEMGRKLADVLLPRPVYALLTSSLNTVAIDSILRIRLCLDSPLIDLPWEYLYRPDVTDSTSLAGFLLFDHRISLVREAPTARSIRSAQQGKQRMVFAGTLWSGEHDRWGVRKEYAELSEALTSVEKFLSLEFITASGNNIEMALIQQTAIFHYSGHTDEIKGRGYLLREVGSGSQSNSAIPPFDLMYSEELSNMLLRSNTRLAVFSACNSGHWAFVEPLLRAGLPGLIGAQGLVSVKAAFAFSEKLYASLAVGLSMDEAVIGARFHEAQVGGFGDSESLEWGVFMVYMPATEVIFLPDNKRESDVVSLQKTARRDSQQTIMDVTKRIGTTPQTVMAVDQRTLRKVIVDRFTVDEMAILCADIKQDLAHDGVELNLDLDTVAGLTQGEEAMILNLITYLDRRGYLSYLVNAVRQARAGSV